MADGTEAGRCSHPFNLILDPKAIYAQSFRIIAHEFGAHAYSPDELAVVWRVIHATGDFDLGRSLRFHPEAMATGIAALRAQHSIVTDVRMVQAGINRGLLDRLGVRLHCLIDDPEVARIASGEGVTRAMVAMREAWAKVGPNAIMVVGNAPTALIELIRLAAAGPPLPDLIVGVPVGIVSAAESKAWLHQSTAVPPYITNVGTKGGSAVAAAVINALAILAEGQR